jgi:cell division protein FtsZ
MGIGVGRGEKLVEEAANSAIHSPLLSRGIEGAKQLLINITGSDELTLLDAHDIVERITEATEVEAPDVIFGVSTDEAAGDEVRVTVIASGFDHQPQTKVLRPNQLKGIAGNRNYDPTNYDIPAFLRYNPDNEKIN